MLVCTPHLAALLFVLSVAQLPAAGSMDSPGASAPSPRSGTALAAELRRAAQAREPMPGDSPIPSGAEAIPQGQARLPRSEYLLLESYPESGEHPGGEPAAGDSGMYRDLLRAERIKRMHDQMKQGTLKWETVRE
ncbi:MAG: hypothetical protein NT005_11845 [Spirochaetes bacterium]|nr:hypothetical protein [Spirochaetota bacterium]